MSILSGKDAAGSRWDVVVVGGGHAGCEAALAAARMGCRTLLVSQSLERLGTMPCNPSVGGLAKSHLVFELDALGGEMAVNADMTGVQFRVLNSSRGPAVRANRAQCDKAAYTARMFATISMQQGLSCLEDECTGLLRDASDSQAPCLGIRARRAGDVRAGAVVITSGTALNGVIHIGGEAQAGGGDGRPGCGALSENLAANGFRLARLKTGTPPRLDVRSIDWSAFDNQAGETPAPAFSWRGWKMLENGPGCSTWNTMAAKNAAWNAMRRDARRCRGASSGPFPAPIFLEGIPAVPPAPAGRSAWNGLPFRLEPGTDADAIMPWPPFSVEKIVSTGHTTAKTAEIVRAHLKDSALYGGAIRGAGVRYCPSFEDKIVKFTDKTEHHVILEPESLLGPAVYPNGLSNSLPRKIQAEMVRSVPGLRDARFIAWGYAIEYDAIDARELDHRLASQRIDRLFFAGQTNGTTGYEEAAAQGLVAGINAALRSRDEKGVTFGRDEAYIGVMIDDLVTKGADEPYRMFTSRAERRLHLRQDNARFRLIGKAEAIGLADPEFVAESRKIMAEAESEIRRLSCGGRDSAGPGAWGRELMRPGARYAKMPFANRSLAPAAAAQVEIHFRYAGYLGQEESRLAKMKRDENLAIPEDIDYFSIGALRYESRERLSRVRPETLAQAARIPGVNPADVAVLDIVIHKLRTACE